MGVFVPVGHCQVALRFACAGVQDELITTFGVPHSEPLDTADDIAEAIKLLCAPATKWLNPNEYASSYTFLGIEVAVKTGAGFEFGQASVNVAGNASGYSPVPVNSAILVRKRTNTGGRKHRGRMYLPPMFISEGDVTAAGVCDGTFITALQNGLNTFRTELAAENLPMEILHSDPGDTPTVVSSLQVMPLLATQRRRMR